MKEDGISALVEERRQESMEAKRFRSFSKALRQEEQACR
jgi:hypothetical protein